MRTRHPVRLLVIALPLSAAATAAVLLAGQGGESPGDPLIAGFIREFRSLSKAIAKFNRI